MSRALGSVAALAAAAALMLHPSIAVRWVSSDGLLETSSRQMLTRVEGALVVVALLVASLAWRWRIHTAARERFAAGALLAIVSLAGSTVAAEVTLTGINRFVRPLPGERHDFFVYDPLLGWKHRPGSATRFKSTIVRIDGEGARAPRHPHPSAASFKILILGDSQVFGDGVQAEDTFADRLQHALAGVRVINAGVIGYGTDQELLDLERRAAAERPNLVIVGLNAYDLRDNLSTRVRSGYAKPRFELKGSELTLTHVPVEGGGRIERLGREIQYRSFLVRLGSRMWRQTGRRVERLDGGDGLRVVYPPAGEFDRSLAVTGAILSRLAAFTRKAGNRVVIVFLPYAMDFSGDATYARQTERLAEGLRMFSRRDGFLVIDLRASLRGEGGARLFLDTMHFSAEGHRRVAEALERELMAAHMIPDGPSD